MQALRKFLNRLFFGLGFSIACLGTATPLSAFAAERKAPLWKMGIDKRIEAATAIIATEFKEGENGNLTEIVSEVLKLDDGVDLHFKVGDVYNEKIENEAGIRKNKISGQIIFMAGNPAKMVIAGSYAGDKIGGMSGLPIKALKQKIEAERN
ncbi:hypothetical protein [Microbulbifer sp. ZKSA002]|uniref:hypothetical protein n=1 Tax=Microbulbifer sp. ZKSA002 TaxID=3243388 RepID=UPI004039B171